MKYFLIAGEASGDLHASDLIRSILKVDPEAEFRFMGGDQMKSVAPGLILHYRETSYMMLDVVFHLRKILRNMRLVRREIASWKPHVVIPVDYPGFNMRISRFAYRQGFRVFYYISPKVWAWKRRRVYKLRKHASRLFTILPFEKAFFREYGIEAEYFGNPLVDRVQAFRKQFEGETAWKKRVGLDERPVIALLAGSRRREIQGLLPDMVATAALHPEYQFVIAGAPSIPVELYEPFLKEGSVKFVSGETYALLEIARAGMVCSGTATLEAALLGVPQVVMYRTGKVAYSIAKRLIKINFISLVNLIAGRGIVREVIQKNMFQDASGELALILEDSRYRDAMLKGYAEVGKTLGGGGISGRIAARMVNLLLLDNTPQITVGNVDS